jgi:hypothetical protein
MEYGRTKYVSRILIGNATCTAAVDSFIYAVLSPPQIKRCFLHDFYCKVGFYQEHFRTVPVKIISADHTFKGSMILKTNAKGSNKNAAQYRAMLILLNEEGLVINFCLTKGESMKEGEDILRHAQRQGGNIDMIVTGTDQPLLRKKKKKTEAVKSQAKSLAQKRRL